MISRKRYEHSLGVQKTAIELAKLYGCSVEKASIAGLIHDCAKGLSGRQLLDYAEKYEIDIDMVSRNQPDILHGPVGAFIAHDVFNINDDEILHAVKCHTTGCRDMSKLDKIIYLADYIEPGRNFPGIADIRKTAYEDLDKGVLMALDSSIKYVIDRNMLVDINSIDARNYMIISEVHNI